jgi:hypothetical protein
VPVVWKAREGLLEGEPRMKKFQRITDPEKMIELMRAYPRHYSTISPNEAYPAGMCGARLPNELRRCCRPAGHASTLHVHAYRGERMVQDPTTDNPNWKMSEVVIWFDDAEES